MDWSRLLLTIVVILIVHGLLVAFWIIRAKRRAHPIAAEPIKAGSIVYLDVNHQIRNVRPDEWHLRNLVGIALEDGNANERVNVMPRGTLPIEKLDLLSKIYKK